MASLKLVNHIPGIDYIEYRDSLYFGKHEYRLRLAGVNHLGRHGLFNPNRARKTRIKAEVLSVLDNVPDWKSKRLVTVRQEGKTLAIFSNDLALLQSIKAAITVKLRESDFTKAVASNDLGIKTFAREPKHKYRAYLKSGNLSKEDSIAIRALIERMPDIHPSRSFKRWLYEDREWMRTWLYGLYYFDFDDETTLSYLTLMYGEVLGRKYRLEKRQIEAV